MKPNKILYSISRFNKDKKWFEFWKKSFITETYYLKVKNGFVVLGGKKNETK